MSNSNTSSISLEEQLRIMDKQLDQLERENERLVVQLKEVIKMNTHWQRYDSQREEYVLKLTRTNQELQDKVSDRQRQVTELSENLKAEIKREYPSLSKEAANLQLDETEVEAAQLELELKASNSSSSSSSLRREEEIAALTDHIAKLKEKISELESGRASRQKDDDEQLALLREQVNICVEDFKQERKDRERCHGENERLRDRLAQAEDDLRAKEEQLYVYQEQIKRLQEGRQSRQGPAPMRRTYDEPGCYPVERPCLCRQGHTVAKQMQNREAIRRSRPTAAYHFGDDFTDLPGDVEVDGTPEGSQDETDGPATNDMCGNTDDGNTETKEALQCPKCLKSFGVDRHCELLDHIETCL